MSHNVMQVLHHRAATWATGTVRLTIGNFSQGSKPLRNFPQLLVAEQVPIECDGFFKLDHHDGERIGRHRRLGRRCEKRFNISGPYAKFSDKRKLTNLSDKTRKYITRWFVVCPRSARFNALQNIANQLRALVLIYAAKGRDEQLKICAAELENV